MRNSKSKSAIIELIEQSDSALSHKEIQKKLDNLCDRVTVYRVLDRLVNEGQVHKVIDFDGVMRFAACHQCETHSHSHDHVHFSCESCKRVICLDHVMPALELPKGFNVSDSLHIVSGKCDQCS